MPRHLARNAAPLLLAASCLAWPPSSLGVEGPENPVYKSWAKFKKGASVTYKSVSEAAGTRYESTMTYRLVELTPDRAVVESQVTVRSGDKEIRNRPQRLENPRAMTLPPGVKPGEPKVEGLLEEGEEVLKVGGRDYKARWCKLKNQVEGGGEALTQTWSSDEVPGGLVKSSTLTTPQKSSMTMELVEVKLP